MQPGLNSFLQRWLVNTIAVLVAANVVSGITYDTAGSLLVAALMLGILNAVLRPILILLALPLLILTLGLFTLVINAILLYFVGQIVARFHVASFHAAFWGGVVISLVSMVANVLIGGGGGSRVTVRRGDAPRPPRDPDPGGGPVIDV